MKTSLILLFTLILSSLHPASSAVPAEGRDAFIRAAFNSCRPPWQAGPERMEQLWQDDACTDRQLLRLCGKPPGRCDRRQNDGDASAR